MKILYLLMIIAMLSACQKRLIIPLVTDHISKSDYYIDNDGQKHDINENNPGIGFEFLKKNIAYTALYLPNNSYRERALFLTASYEHEARKNLYLSAGAGGATGYELISGKKITPVPLIAIRYKFLKLVTSYPFSALFSDLSPPNDEPSDFASLLFYWEFE